MIFLPLGQETGRVFKTHMVPCAWCCLDGVFRYLNNLWHSSGIVGGRGEGIHFGGTIAVIPSGDKKKGCNRHAVQRVVDYCIKSRIDGMVTGLVLTNKGTDGRVHNNGSVCLVICWK